MSVLKYNNNGTWEGLNIDHASTADSALYDADGNVISSTYAKTTDLDDYLPLTAGSSKPLIGNLHIDSQATAESYLCMYANDAMRGQLWTSGSTGQYPSLFIGAFNGSTQKATVQLNSNEGYAILAAASHYIYFRPNGVNSTTGQVYLGTDGQFRGGHPMKAESSGTISKTVTTSGFYPTTIPVPSGCTHCLQTFQASFVSSTAQMVTVVVNGSSTQSYFPASANTRYLSVSGLYEGMAACSIKPESANITCNGWVFRTIWF